MGAIMSESCKSLNDLFKEIYADKLQNMVPGLMKWNYWSMPLDKLAKHVEYNEEAAQVYKTRTSKLGKYLEGHD
jgi:hypothetical protein